MAFPHEQKPLAKWRFELVEVRLGPDAPTTCYFVDYSAGKIARRTMPGMPKAGRVALGAQTEEPAPAAALELEAGLLRVPLGGGDPERIGEVSVKLPAFAAGSQLVYLPIYAPGTVPKLQRQQLW